MKTYQKAISMVLLLLMIPLSCYGESLKPVAAFTFVKPTFQQSEPLQVIDSSYTLGDQKIVKVEWTCIIKGKQQKSVNIKTLLKDAPIGEYIVFLRVKDSSGTWSDPVGQKVKIVANQSIKLTGFASAKSTYDIGEKLDLTYTYENPNDLEITGQRWRYRNITTNGSNISGKPKYFKKSGLYEITLEVQDEWGNWSNKMSCQIRVGVEVVERNGYYLFEKGIPGDLIEGYVDKDYNNFEAADIVKIDDIPGTLMMSNSPETIYASGILYQDTVLGRGRLILHHANGTEYAKKLLITVTNPGSSTVSLETSNHAVKGPGRHTMQLGQSAVYTYMKGTQTEKYTIDPGQTLCIYSSLSVGTWDQNEVVTGTIDFVSDQKLTWKVVALDAKSAMENISKLSVLERDSHDRGTFNVLERHYTVDLSNITELKKLVIGKGKDEWLQGIDATTGETIYNRGNYGMPIKINVINNEDMGVIINARGGAYMGALKWLDSKVFKVPGEQVLKEHAVAALVGNIKQGEENEIVYMLPNGSSAPILFGFIPKSTWK